VQEIMGVEGGLSAPDTPFVMVAHHLAPSEVTALPDHARGVLCTGGNHTSHSAILLRSRGIPTVFQTPGDVQDVEPGQRIALDGSTGEVWLEVPDDVAADLEEQREREAEQARRQRSEAQQPALTRDGTSIRVEANVNQPGDASLAAQNGADGIGLLRTEFLFPPRHDPPSEDEQVERLRAVLQAVPDRTVTVRVLDVGGDKPLPYVSLPDERNPFLGIRGIRLLLRENKLFHTQLRSLLRVAADRPVRIMLPMVVSTDEIRRSRDAVERARSSLVNDGLPVPSSVEVGAMIETPASALGADRLAETADFFSIGTNDLTQYTVAVDREHAELSELTDVLNPPVLALIREIVRSADDHGIPVSCCGEAASDPVVIPIFLGLGLRSLSVSPPSIPEVKSLIRSLDLDACRRLADDALRSDDPAATRRQSRQLRSDSTGGSGDG
jgi:phosphocarrier protein FPr